MNLFFALRVPSLKETLKTRVESAKIASLALQHSRGKVPQNAFDEPRGLQLSQKSHWPKIFSGGRPVTAARANSVWCLVLGAWCLVPIAWCLAPSTVSLQLLMLIYSLTLITKHLSPLWIDHFSQKCPLRLCFGLQPSKKSSLAPGARGYCNIGGRKMDPGSQKLCVKKLILKPLEHGWNIWVWWNMEHGTPSPKSRGTLES